MRLSLLLLLLPCVCRAEQMHYAAYAAGLNVLRMDAQLELRPQAYRVRVDFWTTGTFGVFVRARSETSVAGSFVDGRAVPEWVVGSGVTNGAPRATEIDYVGGSPVVRRLLPPVAEEREPVPDALQRGTVDTLSAMAQLIRQVNASGRCDGATRTFDGRRLSELRAATVGMEVLAATRLSTYAGPALHCTFEGRQLAGFPLDGDRERLARPQTGGAWFAAVSPGGPMVPVRIAFRTRWFGDTTLFIAARD